MKRTSPYTFDFSEIKNGVASPSTPRNSRSREQELICEIERLNRYNQRLSAENLELRQQQVLLQHNLQAIQQETLKLNEMITNLKKQHFTWSSDNAKSPQKHT